MDVGVCVCVFILFYFTPVNYLTKRYFRGKLFSRNKFSRLKTRKVAKFAEFIFVLHALKVKFAEFIFTFHALNIYFHVSLCVGKFLIFLLLYLLLSYWY